MATATESPSLLEHDLRMKPGTSPLRPRLDPSISLDDSERPIPIHDSDFQEGSSPRGPTVIQTPAPPPRKASLTGPASKPPLGGTTPIDRVVDDRDVPERVGVLDDQLSPMINRAVKFSFAIKENKHHTPRHSENYKATFRFQKSTMRQRPRRRDSLEIIRQDRARQALTQKCLEVMAKGCVATKYNRFGNACRRIVTVDKEGTELRWESSFEHESRKKGIGFMARKPRLRQLADITGVIYSSLVEFAHRRSRFYQYNQQGNPPWLCLTVLFDQETLDLVFKNEEEVDTWFFGLQNLAPMSKFYLPRGPQLIFRAQLKIEHMSKRVGKPILEILVDLVRQAKESVKKETEEREKEEKLAKVVIEGVLKKKSPKEVLGKHMWQNRWFRLEQTPDYMHSRLLYYKEKGGEVLGNIPVANIRAVTVPEKKKEGRFDIELKGGMVVEQRMFALLAAEETIAQNWRDSLGRLINLVNAHTPVYKEAKFWKPYVAASEQIPEVRNKKPPKKSPSKETYEESTSTSSTGSVDKPKKKSVHFHDELPLPSSSSTSSLSEKSKATSPRDLEEDDGSSEDERDGGRGDDDSGRRRRSSSESSDPSRPSPTFLVPPDSRAQTTTTPFNGYVQGGIMHHNPSPSLPYNPNPLVGSGPYEGPYTPTSLPTYIPSAIPAGISISSTPLTIPIPVVPHDPRSSLSSAFVPSTTLHTAIPPGVQTSLTLSMSGSPPLIKPIPTTFATTQSSSQQPQQQIVRPTVIKPTPSGSSTQASPITRPRQTGPDTPPLGSENGGSGTFPLSSSSTTSTTTTTAKTGGS